MIAVHMCGRDGLFTMSLVWCKNVRTMCRSVLGRALPAQKNNLSENQRRKRLYSQQTESAVDRESA